ncbi:hypothetical protein J2W55_001996 [Mucilaginibacter pocheonensis]|uniref:Uncharacterized protein n=1 Tax=Mucilaginibacter pocheonensis TaxID=398050 RepID=A0ABU1TA27_9SPHI|nr:hypothetical protein [Mucilaginibacter pocheonensis]
MLFNKYRIKTTDVGYASHPSVIPFGKINGLPKPDAKTVKTIWYDDEA